MKHRMLASSAIGFLMVAAVLIAFAQSISASAGIRLRPPFTGTYRVTSYFDHNKPQYCTGADGYIWIYNGERTQSSCSAHTGQPYPYDGHDGWDFSMVAGTDVLATADGEVVFEGTLYGNTLIIAHGDNYFTQYSHLSAYLVNNGDPVVAGQHIAESGSSGTDAAHLHFTVSHGGFANTVYTTDPFGWRGAQRDPLFDYTGRESSCLWRSSDSDPISCYDTIIEDAGRGSQISGTWLVSTIGNGYHAFYRRNVSGSLEHYANWLLTNTLPGPYQVYAFVPSQNATTHRATYYIYTVSSWLSRTIDQQIYNDEWVLLGTYQLPANFAYVQLVADTGEISNTTWIAVDAIKLRLYPDFLPLVLKQPTPMPTICTDC